MGVVGVVEDDLALGLDAARCRRGRWRGCVGRCRSGGGGCCSSEEGRHEWRASCSEPNRSGNAGQYLTVLNIASEYGLSLETCGRERLRVMFSR